MVSAGADEYRIRALRIREPPRYRPPTVSGLLSVLGETGPSRGSGATGSRTVRSSFSGSATRRPDTDTWRPSGPVTVTVRSERRWMSQIDNDRASADA